MAFKHGPREYSDAVMKLLDDWFKAFSRKDGWIVAPDRYEFFIFKNLYNLLFTNFNDIEFYNRVKVLIEEKQDLIMGDVSQAVFDQHVYSDPDFHLLTDIKPMKSLATESTKYEQLLLSDMSSKNVMSEILVDDEITVHENLKEEIELAFKFLNETYDKTARKPVSNLFHPGPTKGKERSLFKLKEYQMEQEGVQFPLWEMKDISRGSYIFDNAKELVEFYHWVVENLKTEFTCNNPQTSFQLTMVKNMFLSEKIGKYDYKDIKFIFDYKYKQIKLKLEVQLILKPIINLKKVYHKFYEITRASFDPLRRSYQMKLFEIASEKNFQFNWCVWFSSKLCKIQKMIEENINDPDEVIENDHYIRKIIHRNGTCYAHTYVKDKNFKGCVKIGIYNIEYDQYYEEKVIYKDNIEYRFNSFLEKVIFKSVGATKAYIKGLGLILRGKTHTLDQILYYLYVNYGAYPICKSINVSQSINMPVNHVWFYINGDNNIYVRKEEAPYNDRFKILEYDIDVFIDPAVSFEETNVQTQHYISTLHTYGRFHYDIEDNVERDKVTSGHLSYRDEYGTDIAYNCKRVVWGSDAFIKVGCTVTGSIRNPQVHMHYYGPWEMDSHLDIRVNDQIYAEKVFVKGEDKGRTTNKISGQNIFKNGDNVITISTHGSNGVLFFGHVEVLEEIDTQVGLLSEHVSTIGNTKKELTNLNVDTFENLNDKNENVDMMIEDDEVSMGDTDNSFITDMMIEDDEVSMGDTDNSFITNQSDDENNSDSFNTILNEDFQIDNNIIYQIDEIDYPLNSHENNIDQQTSIIEYNNISGDEKIYNYDSKIFIAKPINVEYNIEDNDNYQDEKPLLFENRVNENNSESNLLSTFDIEKQEFLNELLIYKFHITSHHYFINKLYNEEKNFKNEILKHDNNQSIYDDIDFFKLKSFDDAFNEYETTKQYYGLGKKLLINEIKNLVQKEMGYNNSFLRNKESVSLKFHDKSVYEMKKFYCYDYNIVIDTFEKFYCEKIDSVRKIEIPIAISGFFKGISWNQVNKSFNVIIKLSFRFVLNGIEHLFTDKFRKSLEYLDIINKILTPSIKINDHQVLDSEIMEEEMFPLSFIYDNRIIDSFHKLGCCFGYAKSFTLNLSDIIFDRDYSRYSLFPFDFSIVNFEFEIDNFNLQLVLESCEGRDYKYRLFNKAKDDTYVNYKFKYKLLDRIITDPYRKSNLISFDLNNFNKLPTHDTYNHDKGFLCKIEDNKAKFYVKIQRVPWNIIKTTTFPLLILQLFNSISISFGEFETKLASLIAIFLAYGQFLIIFNEMGLTGTNLHVMDKINYLGFIIVIIQYGSMIIEGYFTNSDVNCEIRVNVTREYYNNCSIMYYSRAFVTSLIAISISYLICWVLIYQFVMKQNLRFENFKGKDYDEMYFRDDLDLFDIEKWTIVDDDNIRKINSIKNNSYLTKISNGEEEYEESKDGSLIKKLSQVEKVFYGIIDEVSDNDNFIKFFHI